MYLKESLFSQKSYVWSIKCIFIYKQNLMVEITVGQQNLIYFWDLY